MIFVICILKIIGEILNILNLLVIIYLIVCLCFFVLFCIEFLFNYLELYMRSDSLLVVFFCCVWSFFIFCMGCNSLEVVFCLFIE